MISLSCLGSNELPSEELDISNLTDALPVVDSWIDDYIRRHLESRVRLSDAKFTRIPNYFSAQLLSRAHLVLVPRFEFPPLADFGLGGLKPIEISHFGGITLKDTFFVTNMGESLLFHEMIHIIQWHELGSNRFLVAYGLGLDHFGYRDSPLEQIAYSMQARFDAGERIENLEQVIRTHCRELAENLGIGEI